MLESFLIYAVVGLMAGFIAGLFGVGGGLIIVPVLAWLFNYQELLSDYVMQMAIGTSLATIVMSATASSYAHHRKLAVNWQIVKSMGMGILLGALLGAGVAKLLASSTLRNVFAIFELLVAVQLFSQVKVQEHTHLPGKTGLGLTGVVIGTISAIVGIGGGSLSVPFLRWCGIGMQKAVATSAALGLPIAIFGVFGFILMGAGVPDLPAYSLGFVYFPACIGMGVFSVFAAPWGAKMAHRLSARHLQRSFAVLLAVIALLMFRFG